MTDQGLSQWENMLHIDDLMQKRCNSSANALVLCLSCMKLFSAMNSALAGFPLTNALGENLPSRY